MPPHAPPAKPSAASSPSAARRSSIGLSVPRPGSVPRATVGKFLGIVSGGIVIVGMITEISERPQRDQDPNCRSIARIDLVGEIKANAAGAAVLPARHHRISDHRRAGDADERPRAPPDLQRRASVKPIDIGVLQQDPSIPAQIDIDELVSKHFAMLGTTGVGKSNGVAHPAATDPG